jgi:hypothetical protein
MLLTDTESGKYLRNFGELTPVYRALQPSLENIKSYKASVFHLGLLQCALCLLTENFNATE